VGLEQNEEIASRIRKRPAPDDVMKSRLRMARVPIGSNLIDNPTGGPQGFSLENVFVMAGIPSVMQAMLSSLDGKLRTGKVVRSHSVRLYLGESQIAEALSQLQDQNPLVDIGSYPFFKDDKYGTVIVIRGTEIEKLKDLATKIILIGQSAGTEPEDMGLTI
jgi:Predicted nucleotide-utilizing enzyme related to molybdopterin-biosynthesis enzyme MoeA